MCKVTLGVGNMEEVEEFKYLGTVLSKYWSMESDVRERVVRRGQATENHEG